MADTPDRPEGQQRDIVERLRSPHTMIQLPSRKRVEHWPNGREREAADEIERLRAELHALRRALVFWNHDHQTSDMLRDRIAEVIERNADAVDQPYNMADAVLSAMHGWLDRLDQTLYDVIPQDDWGIALEGDDA